MTPTYFVTHDTQPWPDDWPPYRQLCYSGDDDYCDAAVGHCKCGACHQPLEFVYRDGALYRYAKLVARLDAPVSPSAARVGEEPAPPWRVLAKANGYCAEGFPPLWWTWNRVKKRFIPTDPWFGDREPTEISVIYHPENDTEAVEIVEAALRAGQGAGE